MRILILEDDPFIALDLQSMLEERGHEVTGVYSSLHEVCHHLDDGFDCALLDIDVVGGKSFGIAAELMERSIPFAFVSASRPHDIPSRLGSAGFIPKPFEERTILRSIEQLSEQATYP